MIPDKLLEIIYRLKEKTFQGDAIWNKASGPGGFQLLLNLGSITMSKWSDENETEHIDFIIFNDKGESIENLQFNNYDNKEEFKMLNELHDVIRRRYLKADEVLDNLLDELAITKKIGKQVDNEKNSDELPF